MFAAGGPDWERVIAGLVVVLLRCSLNLAALSLFAESRGLFVGIFAGVADVGNGGLLPFTLGSVAVSVVARVGVSTLGTPTVSLKICVVSAGARVGLSTLGNPTISLMRFTLGTPSAFWMRCMDRVTCWSGLGCKGIASAIVLDRPVASLSSLFPSSSLVRVVRDGSVILLVALSALRLTMRLVASRSWLRLLMSLSFFSLPMPQMVLMHVAIALTSLSACVTVGLVMSLCWN